MMEKYQPEENDWKFEESPKKKQQVIEIQIRKSQGKNLGYEIFCFHC